MSNILGTLSIGALLTGLTVLVHIGGLITVTSAASAARQRRHLHGRSGRIIVMVGVVIGLFAIATVEIWTWALCHLLLQVAPDLESALYLSTVTYSTVGYGDVVPAKEWRMLAALEGVTGFLMIGWSTAYLVTASTRVGPFRPGDHF